MVKDEPKWDRCPASVRRLLRRCLQKDPKDRLHDIADAALLLDETPFDVAPVSVSRRAAPWAVAAVCALTAVVALWAPWRTPPPAPEPIRTQVHVPDNVNSAGRNFTLSPDGRKLAFSAVVSDGVARVWIRFMDSLEVRPLAGDRDHADRPTLLLVSRQPVHRVFRHRRKTQEGGSRREPAAGAVRHDRSERPRRRVEPRRRDRVR